jgi:L-fuculose-phosphate aldolase
MTAQSMPATADQSSERALRQIIVEAARKMSSAGLSPGRTGNVSARCGAGFLITPSGVAYDVMTANDVVYVDGEGAPRAGQLKASSELAFHLSSYRQRPDRAAIVHTHSMYATVLACARSSIPAFHYMVAAAGGKDIPCVPYATFGTPELAKRVARGVKDRDACLMANHGAIALGQDVPAALELAFMVETLAQQYVMLLGIAKPKVLSGAEMTTVIERFKSYGQRAQAAAKRG